MFGEYGGGDTSVGNNGGYNFGGGGYGGLDTSGWGDAPDVGTIGGTMGDEYGENSATLGGGLSGAQADANNQAMSIDGGMGFDSGYDWGAAGLASPDGFNSYNLGNMFGTMNPVGLPTRVSEYEMDTSPTFSSFMESPMGRFTRSLLGMTPLGRVANIGYAATQGNLPGVVGGITSAATGSGLLGGGAALATAGAQGQNVSRQAGQLAGSTLGGYAGSQAAGPLGGFFGSAIGGRLGQAAATGTGGQAQSPNGGMGSFAAGLAGMYAANRAAKDAQRAQQTITQASANNNTQVQQQLADMFGPNSAYAQQLRQQLERKDAASGRRSQYGPREVELQARLADMQSRSAPGLMNAYTSQQQQIVAAQQAALQAAQARRAQQQATLNNLLQLGRNTGAMDWAGNQLGNLFNQSSSTPWQNADIVNNIGSEWA
jgi:hypothetical protein